MSSFMGHGPSHHQGQRSWGGGMPPAMPNPHSGGWGGGMPQQPPQGPVNGAPPSGGKDPETARREQEKREKRKRAEYEARKREEERKGKDDARKKQKEEDTRRKVEKKLETVTPDPAGNSRLKMKTDFLCPYRFRNTLPDVPLDPKLLTHPFDGQRHIKYRYDNALEASYKHEIVTELDMGIPIDLIDPHAYDTLPGIRLDPADMALLKKDTMPPPSSRAIKDSPSLAAQQAARERDMRNKQRQSVTWLRKTPILSNNLYDPVHKFTRDGLETKVALSASRDLISRQERQTLQQQIEAIEKTFDTARDMDVKTVRHPTKEGVRAVSMMPVFPDFDCWSNIYTHLTFDIDPALESEGNYENPLSEERVRAGLIKGFSNPDDETQQFVAYLVPKEGEKNAAEDEEVEYEWVRPYTYEIKKQEAKQAKQDRFFFVMTEDKVMYNEMSSRVACSRKTFKGADSYLASFARPSKISLSRRAMAEEEEETRSRRLKQIATQGTPKLIQYNEDKK